uniref:Uncharacterized protein n=1 Tax=Plectus sambesii TaxID=2011161 RepID=A0A914WUE6_9BILA
MQSSSLIRPGKEDKTIAFALYDFNPSNEGQISFKKGDRMTLLDTRSQIDWWLAEHAQSGQTGYVPKNYITTENEGTADTPKWMAGHITRDQAEYWVLQDKLPLGAFLIREKDASLNKKEFVLTVRDAENQPGGNVKHYRIQQSDVDGYLFIRPSTQTFKTLEELVEHYSSHMDGLCCKLTMAALRPSSSKARTAISWEIPRSHLQLMKQIGSGNFGEVWF